MSAEQAANVDVEALATSDEIASFLRVDEQTLANWRHKGTGPAYIKVGAAVRYCWAEIDRWTAAGSVTPSPGNGAE